MKKLFFITLLLLISFFVVQKTYASTLPNDPITESNNILFIQQDFNTYLFQDSFTDSDNTLLTTHNINYVPFNCAGDKLESNRLIAVSGCPYYYNAFANTQNQSIAFDLISDLSKNISYQQWTRVTVTASNTSALQTELLINTDGSGWLRFWDNYAWTVLQTYPVNYFQNGATYNLNTIVIGQSLTIYINGIQQYTNSNIVPLSITQGGFAFNFYNYDNYNDPSTTAAIDNLVFASYSNQPPVVGVVSVSNSTPQVNTSITASAGFEDADTLDTHTAIWDWGDGSTSSGTVNESDKTVSGSHTYTTAGVYELTLTITDSSNASGSQTYQYVSVYAPTLQGLFSAGTKYISPVGSYFGDIALTGQVKFGLNYKYMGSIPTDHKSFSIDFDVANFHFNATSVSSLVISNGVGILRGTGTLNGSGTYNYLVTGSDIGDTIRIQIKTTSGSVIYDTQPGTADTATPTLPVTGNVNVH